MKNGDIEALNMVNKQADKFPKKILIAGGISYYGLSDLIIVKGTMTILLMVKHCYTIKKILMNLN